MACELRIRQSFHIPPTVSHRETEFGHPRLETIVKEVDHHTHPGHVADALVGEKP